MIKSERQADRQIEKQTFRQAGTTTEKGRGGRGGRGDRNRDRRIERQTDSASKRSSEQGREREKGGERDADR